MAEDLQPQPPLIGDLPGPRSVLLPEPVKLVHKRTDLPCRGITPYRAGY